MNKLFQIKSIFLSFSIFLVTQVSINQAARADFTATVSSISPAAVDITSTFTHQPHDANIAQVEYQGTIGQTYTVVFAVSAQPGPVAVIGGEISNFVFDANAKTVSITFKMVAQVGGDTAFGDHFIINLQGTAVDNDPSSPLPPVLMRGAYMSTNVANYKVIYPTRDAPAFGFELTGPSGSSGTIKMFIPSQLLTLIKDSNDVQVPIANLAIFNNSDQVSSDITDVGTGVTMGLSLLFSEDSSAVSRHASRLAREARILARQAHISAVAKPVGKSVIKKITVGEKKALSLTSSNLKITKSIKLFGFVKDQSYVGSKVFIQKKGAKNVWKTLLKTTIAAGGKFGSTLKAELLTKGSNVLRAIDY